MIEEATTKAREGALGKVKTAQTGRSCSFSGCRQFTGRDKNNPHINRVQMVSTVAYYLSD
jgi:hypothetical protein